MKDSGPRDLLKRARVDEAGRFKAGAQWDDDREEQLIVAHATNEYFTDRARGSGGEVGAAAADRSWADALFDPSDIGSTSPEMDMIRSVHAKLRRVDSRLAALHEWVQETRVWTEKVQGGQKMKRRLEKMLLETQVQAESMLSEAESRARQIVDEAEVRARKTAKQIVGDAEERARKIVRRAEKASELLREEAAEACEAVEAERAEVERARAGTFSPEMQATPKLFESIQVFVRTNSALLDELNTLLGAMGLEPSAD